MRALLTPSSACFLIPDHPAALWRCAPPPAAATCHRHVRRPRVACSSSSQGSSSSRGRGGTGRPPQGCPYSTLDLDPSASADDIKAAYRRAARSTHPDVNNATDAAETFKAVHSAYLLLSDPARRAAYDSAQRRASSSSTSGGVTWHVEESEEGVGWQQAAGFYGWYQQSGSWQTSWDANSRRRARRRTPQQPGGGGSSGSGGGGGDAAASASTGPSRGRTGSNATSSTSSSSSTRGRSSSTSSSSKARARTTTSSTSGSSRSRRHGAAAAMDRLFEEHSPEQLFAVISDGGDPRMARAARRWVARVAVAGRLHPAVARELAFLLSLDYLLPHEDVEDDVEEEDRADVKQGAGSRRRRAGEDGGSSSSSNPRHKGRAVPRSARDYVRYSDERTRKSASTNAGGADDADTSTSSSSSSSWFVADELLDVEALFGDLGAAGGMMASAWWPGGGLEDNDAWSDDSSSDDDDDGDDDIGEWWLGL